MNQLITRPEIETDDLYTTEICFRAELAATEIKLNRRGYQLIQTRQSKNRFYLTGLRVKRNDSATH
jgi:hypothetical protein